MTDTSGAAGPPQVELPEDGVLFVHRPFPPMFHVDSPDCWCCPTRVPVTPLTRTEDVDAYVHADQVLQ